MRNGDGCCFIVVFDRVKANGELEEVVAHNVGGEMILQQMIHNKKAVAYRCDGIQFIRRVQHEWNDTPGLNHTTELGGRNEGPDALWGYVTRGGGRLLFERLGEWMRGVTRYLTFPTIARCEHIPTALASNVARLTNLLSKTAPAAVTWNLS